MAAPPPLACLHRSSSASSSRLTGAAARLRRSSTRATAPTPARPVLYAHVPVGVYVHAPMSGQSAALSPFLSLVASGVREPDPRRPCIITYFHLLEALELPMTLRMLELGEEECFFIDVFVFALVMSGRRAAPCTSLTAAVLATPPPLHLGRLASPSATVTWSQAERDLAGRSRAPAHLSRALGRDTSLRRTVMPTLG